MFFGSENMSTSSLFSIDSNDFMGVFMTVSNLITALLDQAVSLRLNQQEGIWILRIEHLIMTFFCASRPCFHHQSPVDGAVPLFAATGLADQLS